MNSSVQVGVDSIFYKNTRSISILVGYIGIELRLGLVERFRTVLKQFAHGSYRKISSLVTLLHIMPYIDLSYH